MTHEDQVMSVVLNRGAPTTVNGFASNDVVRFGFFPDAKWNTFCGRTFRDGHRT